MQVLNKTITIETTGQGFYELTNQINQWVDDHNIDAGLVNVFCRHTSASLIITENADPDVLLDLAQFFKQLAPEKPSLYRHGMEGPDDMPAHIKSVLGGVNLSIPIVSGKLALGTWQGIYLVEHRTHDHIRSIIITTLS
jgi:secondary thiamine-phosphate synthase enzyme